MTETSKRNQKKNRSRFKKRFRHSEDIQIVWNGKLFVLTLLAAGLLAWSYERLLPLLEEQMPTPAAIGVLFTLSTVVIGLLCAAALHTKAFRAITETRRSWKNRLKILFLLGVMFSAGTGLEWVYEQNLHPDIQSDTSYLFLIDESGSMKTNDPTQVRFEALKQVLEQKEQEDPNFQAAVYTFSTSMQEVWPLASLSQGIPDLKGSPQGRANINASLSKLFDICTSYTFQGGSAPKIILLSDGYGSDIDWTFQGLLNRFAAKGITISTVGLGRNADAALLNSIAQTTGGAYVMAEDAGQLIEAMKEAVASQQEGRNLLSVRRTPRLDWLYCAERIFFISILGWLLGKFCQTVYDWKPSRTLIKNSFFLKSILSALWIEFAVQSLPSQAVPIRMAFWLAFACVMALRPLLQEDPVFEEIKEIKEEPIPEPIVLEPVRPIEPVKPEPVYVPAVSKPVPLSLLPAVRRASGFQKLFFCRSQAGYRRLSDLNERPASYRKI